jgi:hypothetical protein
VRGKESYEDQSKSRTTFFNPGLYKVSCLWATKGVYEEVWDLPNMF